MCNFFFYVMDRMAEGEAIMMMCKLGYICYGAQQIELPAVLQHTWYFQSRK